MSGKSAWQTGWENPSLWSLLALGGSGGGLGTAGELG